MITCYTLDQAEMIAAMGSSGGTAGSNAGEAGNGDEASAGRGGGEGGAQGGKEAQSADECPPVDLIMPYQFGTSGPTWEDGKCCYGYVQICG